MVLVSVLIEPGFVGTVVLVGINLGRPHLTQEEGGNHEPFFHGFNIL